jgi:hypothetical protein
MREGGVYCTPFLPGFELPLSALLARLINGNDSLNPAGRSDVGYALSAPASN